jgi:hypothetical protein
VARGPYFCVRCILPRVTKSDNIQFVPVSRFLTPKKGRGLSDRFGNSGYPRIGDAFAAVLQGTRELGKSRDSSVGVATRYVLDGPGIESRWGRDFPQPSRPALGPTQPPIQWAPDLCRGQSGRGVALTTHPNLAPRLKEE